ncbi:hypothetical protein CK203_055191 [Vitis vinifera]|uniref:Uncharacterized protein n=1 Tax=Vitis vinifera TaxID=29760 RepID=A0A438GHT4_VITVI|nr:hypothetical protein CK203_055191 [Vitis vinifera]
MTTFILFSEEYGPVHRYVQIVTRSGKIAQPPHIDRPFAGTNARKDVQRENDEILCQLRTTQARISIWSLLASSSTHRDAWATCIVFSNDDLPLEESSHIRPLYPSPLAFLHLILGFLHKPSTLKPSTLMTGLRGQLWVLRIQSSFNLHLGSLWIHEASAIPSSLHQKVKFTHEGHIITIQSDKDVVTSFEPVLQISHSEDDLHFTRFTFDMVQVISLEDDSRDMVPMSLISTAALCKGRASLLFTVDHDIPHGLGYTPSEEDA